MKRTLCLSAAALILLVSGAFGQPGDCGHGRGDGKMRHGMMQGRMQGHGPGPLMMLAEELKLTDEQIDKLEAMRTAFQVEQIDRQAELKKARLRMTDLMRDEDAREADVMASIDALARLRADLAKMRYQHHRAVQSILTDEQKAELKELRPRMGRRMMLDDDDFEDGDDEDAPEAPRMPRGPRGRNDN